MDDRKQKNVHPLRKAQVAIHDRESVDSTNNHNWISIVLGDIAAYAEANDLKELNKAVLRARAISLIEVDCDLVEPTFENLPSGTSDT